MSKRRKIHPDVNKQNKRHQSDKEHVLSLVSLGKCVKCNRHFTPNRLKEHENACKQSGKFHSNSLYRYHYDSKLHRWKGLDYMIKRTPLSNPKRTDDQYINQHFPQTHWREKHQQFQNTIKVPYKQTAQHGFIQSSDHRSYECSSCHRKFAIETTKTKHKKHCKID